MRGSVPFQLPDVVFNKAVKVTDSPRLKRGRGTARFSATRSADRNKHQESVASIIVCMSFSLPACVLVGGDARKCRFDGVVDIGY